LAIGVVAFHVGGGNWVIGRAAVFAFYFVSGFLICPPKVSLRGNFP